MSNLKIGDKVEVTYNTHRSGREVRRGIIIAEIEAGRAATLAEVIAYYEVNEGDRHYNFLLNKVYTTRRLVIKRDNGHYIIIPDLPPSLSSLSIKRILDEDEHEYESRIVIHNGIFAYHLIVDGKEVNPLDFIKKHASKLGYVLYESGDGSCEYTPSIKKRRI